MAWDDDFEQVRGPRQKVKHPTTPEDFPYESTKRAEWAKARADEMAATEATGNFEGNMGGVAPVAAPAKADWTAEFEVVGQQPQGDWASLFEEVQEETPLFSLKGGGSLLRQIGPRLARGIIGMQLRDLEGVQASRLAGGAQIGDVGDDLTPKIREKQLALAEIDADLQKIRGNPSKPLEVAQDAIASIAENAPGIGTAIVSRNIGPMAAVPALEGAYQSASGHAYAGYRGGEKPPVESVEEAQIAAHGAGVAEVGFELMPMNYLIKNLGKEGVIQFIKGYLVRDFGTELGTTAVNKVTEWSTVEQDKPVGEFLRELKEELIHTGLVTLVASPLTAGGATAIQRAGRLGKQREDEPVELPGLENPIAESSEATDLGAVFGENSAPTSDLRTLPLEAKQQTELETTAAQIHPEEIDEKTLTESARIFAEAKKRDKSPAIPNAEMAWSQISAVPTTAVEDAGELGASARSTANAANYVNPNTGDRLDREFSRGPAEAVGLTPRQIAPKAGTYVLGKDTDDRPADYMGPLYETMEQWRAQYIPNATLILSNEQLYTNSALGKHYTTGVGKHLIVPAVLRKPSKGWGQYNPNTIATAFYNATHEFGHALITERFYQMKSDQAVGQLRDASRRGIVPAELAVGLPEEQQAVVAEFNAVKQRILNDEMTAAEFVEEWMGPAKIGRANFLKDLGVSAKAPAKQLVNAIAERAAQNSNITQKEARAATKQQLVEDFLSLDEYLAEQTARFAYKKRWDESTPLGKFFSETLRIMRQFFIDRKKDGDISPGIAFQEWMEGLGATPRPLEEVAELGKRKAKIKGKPKAAVKTAAKPAKRVKPKAAVEKVQHNVESDTHQKQEKVARGMVVALVRSGLIERGDNIYNDLMGFANRGEFEEFREVYTSLSGKTVKFEYDPPPDMDATRDPEWKKLKFRSPEFKAWFGDWERDPQGASKIRVGAFKQDRMGIISVDDVAVAPPLVLFTTAARLKSGDNAFHASTPRGQQFVESRSMDSPEEADLVPVVLNMRNPYIQGDFHAPAPSRQDLIAQRYDGIVYQNDLDGDLSFVVFRPNQIKVVADRTPYSATKGWNLELDHDQSTKIGEAMTKHYRAIKNFVVDPSRMNRALKHAAQGMRFAMQIQQIAEKNPEVNEVQLFSQTNTEYTSYKSSRLSAPDKTLDYWEDMPNRAFENNSKFLRAQAESGERWFDLKETNKVIDGRTFGWWEVNISEKTIAKAREFGIDYSTPEGKEQLAHLRNIENSLLDSLNEDERIIINLLAHRHGHNPLYFNAAVVQLKYQIHALRKMPFLPRKWFGKYVLIVQEKAGTGYETVHKEAYDYAFERDDAFEKISARLGPNRVIKKEELSDTQFVMMGLPKDFLDVVGTELGLEPDQVEKLSEILQPVKQEKLLKDRDLKDLGITGHSQDVMRSYASYTWHHSNLQAKMLYRKQFNLAIGSLRREVEELAYTGLPEYYKKYGILKAMEGTRDYIMSPPNEWHSARAAVSIMYLLGNLKTAVANSFGLALSWSDVTARYGAVEGEKRFMQAVYRNAATTWAKETLPADIQAGLAKALEEGVLDQTYAYHLAGAANSSRMWRALSRRRAIRYFQKTMDAGMFPFRMVELFTRRITFLIALQENLDRKMSFKEAYEAAVQKTNHLQNDYTAGNRVPFMRGKMAMVTIFMSFAQHAGFHSLGQYEAGQRALIRNEIKEGKRPEKDMPTKTQWLHGHTARIWALMFFLAGYEGLPFAENMLDVAEWIWKRFGKKPIRQELREMVQSMDQDPHLWARGLSHNVAGFDVSRSVGFGRLFPGTEMLARTQKENFNEHVGTLALDLAGVTGHTLKWLYEMSPASDKPLDKAMRSAPGMAGNLWNAYEWSKYGVRGPNGGKITRDKDGNVRDLTAAEILGKAAGFNPTIVSEKREVNFELYDREVYWTSRRNLLKQDIWKGVMQGDREYEREAREAVKEFNDWLGNDPEWRKLRIDNGEIARYIQGKKRRQRLEETQQPINRRFRNLHQDIRKSYDAPDEEGNS